MDLAGSHEHDNQSRQLTTGHLPGPIGRAQMPVLSGSIETHVRRSRYVSLMREPDHRRTTQQDGAVLSSACLRLWGVLSRAALGIRAAAGHLPRVCLLFLVLGFMAGACPAVCRDD